MRKFDSIKENMKPFYFSIFVSALLIPRVALAQATTIVDLIGVFQTIIGALVPLIIGLAVLAILIGLAKYAFRAGDEKAQDEGRRTIFWGIITLFIMVSLWGFVGILSKLFFGEGYTPTPPTIPVLPTTITPAPGNNGCPAGGC